MSALGSVKSQESEGVRATTRRVPCEAWTTPGDCNVSPCCIFGRGKISSLMGDVAKGIKSFKKGMASDVTDEPEPKNISDENQDTKNKE